MEHSHGGEALQSEKRAQVLDRAGIRMNAFFQKAVEEMNRDIPVETWWPKLYLSPDEPGARLDGKPHPFSWTGKALLQPNQKQLRPGVLSLDQQACQKYLLHYDVEMRGKGWPQRGNGRFFRRFEISTANSQQLYVNSLFQGVDARNAVAHFTAGSEGLTYQQTMDWLQAYNHMMGTLARFEDFDALYDDYQRFMAQARSTLQAEPIPLAALAQSLGVVEQDVYVRLCELGRADDIRDNVLYGQVRSDIEQLLHRLINFDLRPSKEAPGPARQRPAQKPAGAKPAAQAPRPKPAAAPPSPAREMLAAYQGGPLDEKQLAALLAEYNLLADETVWLSKEDRAAITGPLCGLLKQKGRGMVVSRFVLDYCYTLGRQPLPNLEDADPEERAAMLELAAEAKTGDRCIAFLKRQKLLNVLPPPPGTQDTREAYTALAEHRPDTRLCVLTRDEVMAARLAALGGPNLLALSLEEGDRNLLILSVLLYPTCIRSIISFVI